MPAFGVFVISQASRVRGSPSSGVVASWFELWYWFSITTPNGSPEASTPAARMSRWTFVH